jgi:hypothetical protein
MAGDPYPIAHGVKRGPNEARLKCSVLGQLLWTVGIDRAETGQYAPSSYFDRKIEVVTS